MAIITEIQKEEEPATTPTTAYDVFLSFRGKDTRMGFTDYLYEALRMETERDQQKKHQGDVKLETEKDQKKKLQDDLKLEMWRNALTEVANLKGINATGRRAMLVIKEAVKEINTRLELHLQRKIPDLIGMDDSISAISSWLKSESSETAEILTIWGMAGIGKTALAKHMYMLHRGDFEKSSFVEDIGRRCAQQTCSQLDLQKQLLRDIVKKRKIEEHNIDLGTSMIEKELLGKRMLLVLDDVVNFDQLDVLIGTKGLQSGHSANTKK
ncbi:hypothetical protein L2E82_11287 [Cichorium intybus]|uniref:Uncharacterized protein n=1 Tax=Cichorium intybus TaxID=13427 RepID=A0ACB9GDZ7_CICIN|nr:hypothetical protein L2E82_11287 [Cichorium intybus]